MTMQKIKSLAFAVLIGSLASSTLQAAESSADYKPFTLSADASTLGLGASAGWRYWDYFGVHAGVNYFNYTRDGNNLEGINFNTKLRLLSGELGLVDFYFSKNSSLRLTFGVLLNQNELSGVAPQDPVVNNTFIPIGGNSYDSSQIGNVNMKAKQSSVSPYLSIGGSFYFDKAHQWALAGELGVAYTGNPKVTLSNSGPGVVAPADLEAERQQLQDKAEDFKFYPIVKVSVSFSF